MPAAHLAAEESRVDLQNLFQGVKQGETVKMEVTSRHRDGTAFPVRVIATLDPADRGRMVMALEAISAERQRVPEALGFIESCLALPEPEGYIQDFLEAGKPIRELLSAYLRSNAPNHILYAQKLLNAFSPASGTG